MRRPPGVTALLLVAASCGSGQSIITAGRQPPTAATQPPPSTLAAGRHAAGRRDAPAAADDHCADHDGGGARHAAGLPDRCPGFSNWSGRDHVLARPQRPSSATSCRSSPTPTTPPVEGRGHPDPGQLRADHRQVPAGRAGQPPRPGADARVHGADDGRHAVGRAGRGLHQVEWLRHQCVPADGPRCLGDRRACSGRCRSTSPTRCCSTTRRCSPPPGSTRRSRRSSLDELRADSQAIVQSGAAKYGLALDSGFDSGGGWYLEQWFAKAGEFYADNENGRAARATKVLYDNPTGRSLLTFLQSMIKDGLAFNVGDNTGGFDNLLKLADSAEPAAMTIATSAALGPVHQHLGRWPVPADRRRRCRRRADARARRQARSAGRRRVAVCRRHRRRRANCGDVGTSSPISPRRSSRASGRRRPATCRCAPTRSTLEPLKTTLATDPRFEVAYDQLLSLTRRTHVGRARARPAP